NDDEENEKCDEGGDTTWCTDQCGQKFNDWAWGDTLGWLSLSCESGEPGVSCTPNQYFVQLTSNNEVIGFAYSDNIGYVCFGTTCNIGGTVTPPAGTLAATLDFDDPQNPQVKGWARAINLTNTLGEDTWISLNCLNDSSCGTSDYRVRVSLTDYGKCSVATSQTCSIDSDCPGSESCNVVEQHLALNGWGWNGVDGGGGNDKGLGWINFNPPLSPLFSFLQTEFGDIYALGGLTGATEAPTYNATYQILANDTITQFSSARGSAFVDDDFGSIAFPSPETSYSNVLGQIDVNSLKTCSGIPCRNKFGDEVVTITDQDDIPDSSTPASLEGKIYYINGSLSITTAKEFLNGAVNSFENGAGTIIVDGDLTVAADITYDDSDNLEKFRNLASVAWIISGDLIVRPNVKKLAGNYIALGSGTKHCAGEVTACSDDTDCSGKCVVGCDPNIAIAGCGQIYSCEGAGNCSADRLTVSGMMMARKFYFERTFSDDTETPVRGSEVIIYDGRLLANIPPGLGDFAQALPIWRPGVFTQ
ncbi:MAG: hypothetical protein CMI53_01175, partial [Parcubacteria group bacterium]|nr:hypothetical protein [Parcubacteria group bacterium]